MSEITPQPPGDGDLTPVPAPPVLVPGPNIPPAPRTDDQKGLLPKWLGTPTVRDALLFGLGFAILIQQVFLSEAGPDAVLTGLGGTLVGLPIVIRTDNRVR